MFNILYKQMLEKWGAESQILKFCEESGELTQALVKQIQKGRWKNRLIEEIADVELMLGQMKYIFEISEKEVKKLKIEKVKKIKNKLRRVK